MKQQYQYTRLNISPLFLTTFDRVFSLLCIVGIFFYAPSVKAQVEWRAEAPSTNETVGTFYQVESQTILSHLTSEFKQRKGLEKLLSLPNELGEMENFALSPVSVMRSDVAKKMPHILTYTGSSLDREGVRVRVTISQRGVSAWIQTPDEGHFFIQPETQKNRHLAYRRTDKGQKNEFQCHTKAIAPERTSHSKKTMATAQKAQTGTLKTFRIAVAATGEYTAYWGDDDDSNGTNQEDAYAAVVATLNRVNEVFETDLGVRLELVTGSELMQVNAATDSFTGNYNQEAQAFFSSQVGEANYDVGQLFGYGDADGDAGCIGCICKNNQKGQAYTIHPFVSLSGGTYLNDYFDLDYVAHELGHQFGAYHTFSHVNEGVGANMEPGSGTTIMGYAGLVGADNVRNHGDPYFHYVSIESINTVVATASCAVDIPLGNTAPVVSAGPNYVIPKGTAYVLEAEGSDANGDALSYCWEQLDVGRIRSQDFGPQQKTGAMARSLPPTVTSKRFIPKWERVLSGTLVETNPNTNSDWETVATTGRMLQWGITVRDRQPVAMGQGGLVDQDDMQIQVDDSSGPFRVVSQNDPTVWQSGNVEIVRWDVAGTAAAPVSTQSVTIQLSVDGSSDFTYTLLEETANDGEAVVVVPDGINTTDARIKVAPLGNIYFAINAGAIEIIDQVHNLMLDTYDTVVCQPDELTIDFTLEHTAATELTFIDLPSDSTGSFSSNTFSAGISQGTLSLQTNSDTVLGLQKITIEARSGEERSLFSFYVDISTTNISTPIPISPSNGGDLVSTETELRWESDSNARRYSVQWSTQADFSSEVQQRVVQDRFFAAESWAPNTTYYWRVQSQNSCGSSTFSEIQQFTTNGISEKTYRAENVPRNIQDSGVINAGVTTIALDIKDTNTILDLNVFLNIEHTYDEDLTLILIAPDGTEVILAQNNGGELDNYTNTLFDQQADLSIAAGSPPFTGTFRPLGNLSNLNDVSVFGRWQLRVIDAQPDDVGRILDFEIRVLLDGEIEQNSDGDSLVDRMDNCPEITNPQQEDFDQDGVGDLCDIDSPNNFKITKYDTTCAGKSNGQIGIDPTADFPYQVSVVGPNGYQRQQSFSEAGTTLSNLAVGDYSLCLTSSADPDFELCYTAMIGEPEPLGVTAKKVPGQAAITLQLTGASEGVEVHINKKQYSGEQLQKPLPLEEGVNELRIRRLGNCQTEYRERLYFASKAMVYPNPTKGPMTLLIGGTHAKVEVVIYPIHGGVIYHKNHRVNATNRSISLDLTGYPSGMYMVRITHQEGTEYLKLMVE